MLNTILVLCTTNGDGVPQDYKEAVKWYRLAAEQGYADAQYNLGLMYSNGEGVPQDYKEAVKWYRLAAEQGVLMLNTILVLCTERAEAFLKTTKKL